MAVGTGLIVVDGELFVVEKELAQLLDGRQGECVAPPAASSIVVNRIVVCFIACVSSFGVGT
jgi:hypothetical protein